MKKEIIKRIVCILLVGVLLSFIPANLAYAKTTYDFEVSLQAGYDSKVLAGYGAPFYINITNKNSSNFEGYIQLIIPGYDSENVLYEEELSLGAGETKTVEIIAGVIVPAEFVNVRVTNKKFKVLWEELQKVTVSKNKNEIRVGVLSDDFSALAYMDRVHLLSDSAKFTSLTELSASNFPTYYSALDMLDCILISDFSTDLLTKEQINALNLWVQKGGLLIIGTGSTMNKTLSGLKGVFVNENLSSTTSQHTTLGLAEEDYAYLSTIQVPTQSSYYNYTYDSFYDSYYYYDFDDYSDPSNYSDYDYDGLNDYIYNYYGGSFAGNDYYDAYQNKIDPSNMYLFEDDAFYVDSNGHSHYKYYDERYGAVIESLDEVIDLLGLWTKEELFSLAYTEYCNLYGYDPKWYLYEQLNPTDEYELEMYFEEYFGEDYDEFLRHYGSLYYEYNYMGLDLKPDLTKPKDNVVITDYKSIDVDCAGIDDTYTKETDQIVFGDSSSQNFVLAKIFKSGEGKIALCAVDFTKNPIPKNEYSGEFVRNLIEKTMGQQLLDEAKDYENNMSSYSFSGKTSAYYENNLIDSAGTAPVPPIIFYVAALFVFFVGILVSYIVCLNKKKTWNLWVIYPVAAIAVSIIIFCIGFSTRVLRLNVNVITLMFPGEISTKEVDYINVIVPKAKEYTVDFSDEVELDRNFRTENSYFSSYTDIDYDAYSVRYRANYDHFQSIISNKVSLENQPFKAEAAYTTQGGIEVAFIEDFSVAGKGPGNLRVTNNYSTVLEDVVVQVFSSLGYKDYYFKKLKSGETVVVDSGDYIDDSSKNQYSYYSSSNYNRLSSHYSKHKTSDIVLGLVFGSLYRGFKDTLYRSSVMDYAMNQYSPDNDHVLVVAFPKSDIAAKIVEGKKSKLTRTEAIIVYEKFDNLPVRGQVQ